MHPVLFEIGPFTVYSYGFMIAIAFALSAFLMWRKAPSIGFPQEKVIDFLTVILISGVLGARLLHVSLNWDYYSKNLLEIILIQKGGLAFYGGLILAVPAAMIFLLRNGIAIEKGGDLMAPFLALGQGLGRIGCFLNGCCYGVVMDDRLPGVIFPGESCTRFPTQIVSTLGLIFIYVVLRAMLEKGVLRNRLFYAYLIFYSVLRFFVEFFRGDVAHATFGMTVSQVICIGIFIGGAAAMILRSFVWKSSSSK